MHDYLRLLHTHGAIMAMVLNKADLLRPEEIGHCRADLMLLLRDVGLYESEVLTTSATADHPTWTGCERCWSGRWAERRAMTDRLAADLTLAAGEMLDEIGDGEVKAKVPDRVARNLAGELVEAAGLEPVCEAVAAGHRRDAGRVDRLAVHPLGSGVAASSVASPATPGGFDRAVVAAPTLGDPPDPPRRSDPHRGVRGLGRIGGAVARGAA